MKQPRPMTDRPLFNAAIGFVLMVVGLELMHFALDRAQLIGPNSRTPSTCQTDATPGRPRWACVPAPGHPLACQNFDPNTHNLEDNNAH
jgi:hypothetical protein